MLSVFIGSITDAMKEKPSVIIIYLVIVFFAFIGVFSIFNDSKISINKYATIDICGKSFKIEKYINKDDGYISEDLNKEIFDACSVDDDLKESIIDSIEDDLKENTNEE